MSSFGFHTTSEEVASEFANQIKGRTFLITGTSDGGLGAHVAITLAIHGPAALILVSRTRARTEPTIRKVHAVNPDVVVHFVQCELSDFDSVRNAAAAIHDLPVSKIDVLVNNAGVMALEEYTRDKQGYELQLSSNHLGHFLLTNLIVAKVVAAGPGSRIVNVSSDGYRVSFFDFDDWNFSKGRAYHDLVAYGQSKTANILFSVALAERFAGRGVVALSVHPGAVMSTGLVAHMQIDNLVDRLYEAALGTNGRQTFAAEPSEKTLSQGGASLLAAALDPAFEGQNGAYIKDCKVVETLEYAHSPELAQRLWELSEELVGDRFKQPTRVREA
ncbi:WW domain-containing oxidoreductase [Colletotrichum sidae]|uniref:WW domain-containing oxidoreductase n=1 Tax=Colletotrichum sidae TaxID=1347389 RepID=A0A4R8TN74_9PEZI|nr:WW domain-containing oxidoreductase [Colletotrichum sidae]